MYDMARMEQFIAQTAQKYGIDPRYALAVARSEGLRDGVWQSNVVKNGRREPSYGPFQLYTGGGLGNEFQRLTGLDPSDPANAEAGVDFALRHAAKNGWGSWYGARDTGIPNFAGIPRGGAAVAVAQPPKTATSTDMWQDVATGMETVSPPFQTPPPTVQNPTDPWKALTGGLTQLAEGLTRRPVPVSDPAALPPPPEGYEYSDEPEPRSPKFKIEVTPGLNVPGNWEDLDQKEIAPSPSAAVPPVAKRTMPSWQEGILKRTRGYQNAVAPDQRWMEMAARKQGQSGGLAGLFG